MFHDPLAYVIAGFVVIAVFGSLVDWIKSKATDQTAKYVGAIQLSRGPITWTKYRDRDGRVIFLLMVRLPSYDWGYTINTDDYGWLQNVWVWDSKKGFQHKQIST